MATLNSSINRAIEVIAKARHVVIVTGAGISAESGVPTFRGGGNSAVWRGMPFTELSSARMVRDDLPLIWEWFDYRRGLVGECEPNPGHSAIADAQFYKRFDSLILVTQNIDGLHQAAGSLDAVELHGNINRARCLSCGHLSSLFDLPAETRPPKCPSCEGLMRPHVVLFGEQLDEKDYSLAIDAAVVCDVCIVVGTSAVVYPANEIPRIAKRSGATVIEVNPERTDLTPLADISILAAAGCVLPDLLSMDPLIRIDDNDREFLSRILRLDNERLDQELLEARKDVVLQLGCEGGGLDITRLSTLDGKQFFRHSGSSIALDENEDEVWNSWHGDPHSDFVAAIDDATADMPIFWMKPMALKPEFRLQLEEYIQRKIDEATPEVRRRMGSLMPENADGWFRWLDRR